MAHDPGFLEALDLDGAVSTAEGTRESHAGDYGTPERDERTPDAVVWPASTADVSAVLSACDERGVPVTPIAAATGLEGGATPVHGGVSLDLSRMDDVLDVRPGDFQVDVEPGVIGSAVDEAVGDHGLFFPPLPSSGDISTVGGMIATSASGMQTVKYGEVADWVLELEAVLPNGDVITAGSKAVKTSSGYNLRDLVVGSEGTLAVVTRATLRLAGIPEQRYGGRASFSTLDDATAAITDAITAGVDVATIELLDGTSATIANDYSGLDLPDGPTVFLEFHADHGVEEEVAFCRTIFETHDVESFEVARAGAGMAELLEARKELGVALEEWHPDLAPVQAGDVTVPISKYGDIVRFARTLGEDHDVPIACFGHAGDGNLHYSVLIDESDPEEYELGKDLYGQIVERAIELGGTATGEHGVGLGKRQFLEGEHGAETVALMRRVKRAFDPNDILNPGKLFPETIDGGRVDLAPDHE